MWSDESTGIDAVARAIAETIGRAENEDGEQDVQDRIADYYLIAHVGMTREGALGRDGRDQEHQLQDGPIFEQVREFVAGRVEAHAQGPAMYLYVVLRKKNNKGNVKISPPLPIGGKVERSEVGQVRDHAVASLAGLAPKLFDIMERLTLRAFGFAEASRADELKAKIMMAELIGEAQAADETAKWQAMGEAVREGAPLVGQAVAAWRAQAEAAAAAAAARATKQPEEMSPEDVERILGRLSPETQAEVMKKLVESIRRAQAQEGDGE